MLLAVPQYALPTYAVPTYALAGSYPEPPAAPSDLTATAASSSRIDLAWTDNAEDVAGVNEVQRFDLFDYAAISSGTVTLAFDGESAEIPYTSLYDGALFQAAIEGIASIGAGNVSVSYNGEDLYHDIEFVGGLAAMALPEITVEASTLEDLYSGPVTPTITEQTAGSPQQWDDVGTEVYRSTDGVSYSLLVDLGANLVSWADDGLTAATRYWYKVRSYNAGGYSAFSNADDDTTFADESTGDQSVVIDAILPAARAAMASPFNWGI